MAVLANITVVQADLEIIQPDIADYIFDSQSTTDLAALVEVQKREIYKQIESQTDYTADELLKVKDYEEGKYIYDKLVNMTLAALFVANGDYDKAANHTAIADAIPLKFYVDGDDDDEVSESEKESIAPVRFGR